MSTRFIQCTSLDKFVVLYKKKSSGKKKRKYSGYKEIQKDKL